MLKYSNFEIPASGANIPCFTTGTRIFIEGVEEVEGVKEFVEGFKKVYEKLGIFNEYNIEIDFEKVEISGGNEVLQKAIVPFITEYFNKEVFFFLHDTNYVGSLRELQEVEAKLNIDTSIVDEYE